MNNKLTIASAIILIAGLGLVADTGPAYTQAAGTPAAMTVGIYTPTVPFKNSAARLQYVQRVSKAIGAATGSKVQGKSYASLGALRKAKPDFAVIDALCYSTNRKWKLLANGTVGGRASNTWALYSRVSGGMPGLKGKKLSYVKMGCRDKDFILNAMLETEVGRKHFSAMVGKPTLSGAVADVASFKTSSAVFAPSGQQKGLSKVFATTSVPGPAFVQVNSKLSKSVVAKVRKAVVGYGGGGAITGWGAASGKPYDSLKRKLRKKVKKPFFAAPGAVRLSSGQVIKTPKSLDDSALTAVKQHFQEPAKRQ